MAQADSVPSSTRQLITGVRANQSTNLRALNLPAVRVQPVDCRYFIGGSDARAITDTNEALAFWFWRERRTYVELEDLPNLRWYAASTGQWLQGSNVRALSCETVGFLLGRLLRSLLRLSRRNKRLRFGDFDGVSPNQLVRSKPQERLK